MSAQKLLENATATGGPVCWEGGQGVFSCVGTFSGATVSLQALGPDGTTWIDAGDGTTMTANGMGLFILPACLIRAKISDGPPSGIYASARRAKG